MSDIQFNTLRKMPLAELLMQPKKTIHLFILEYPLLNKNARFQTTVKQ